jgi:hypothetical protein
MLAIGLTAAAYTRSGAQKLRQNQHFLRPSVEKGPIQAGFAHVIRQDGRPANHTAH